MRTLFILVTLICVYFGLWQATKFYGVRDVVAFNAHRYLPEDPDESIYGKYYEYYYPPTPDSFSPLPFVVLSPEFHNGKEIREVYFWLFGATYTVWNPNGREPGERWFEFKVPKQQVSPVPWLPPPQSIKRMDPATDRGNRACESRFAESLRP